MGPIATRRPSCWIVCCTQSVPITISPLKEWNPHTCLPFLRQPTSPSLRSMEIPIQFMLLNQPWMSYPQKVINHFTRSKPSSFDWYYWCISTASRRFHLLSYSIQHGCHILLLYQLQWNQVLLYDKLGLLLCSITSLVVNCTCITWQTTFRPAHECLSLLPKESDTTVPLLHSSKTSDFRILFKTGCMASFTQSAKTARK